jgi:hypothetical protein
LLRPEANLRENPFVASHKFAKEPAMTLRVNLSRKNFHSRDPGFFNLTLVPVRVHKFAGIHASL